MTASSCSGSRWFKYYKQQIKEKRGITPAFLFELLLNKGRLCRKGEAMNIRKDIDYSAMFNAMDDVMAAGMTQMELYCELGRLICTRPEKGAAVAAAEHFKNHYQDVNGFSPRNMRRMRDFYRFYGEHSDLLALSLKIGWTQNVIILEADLNLDERRWYLRATAQFGWSKAELKQKIDSASHLEINLDGSENTCYTDSKNTNLEPTTHEQDTLYLSWEEQDGKPEPPVISALFKSGPS